MRVQVIRIGNSRGIRIPKRVLEECGIEDEMELAVENDEIHLRPVRRKAREGWAEAIGAIRRAHGDEALDDEWLDAALTDGTAEDAWE